MNEQTKQMQQTSYHTALVMVSQAICLPQEQQIPYVNRVAQLAAPVGDEGDQKAWLDLRKKMHASVRKVMVAIHELAERFEDFDLADPAKVSQLDLWPTERIAVNMATGRLQDEDRPR